jgi:hypothetical protein
MRSTLIWRPKGRRLDGLYESGKAAGEREICGLSCAGRSQRPQGWPAVPGRPAENSETLYFRCKRNKSLQGILSRFRVTTIRARSTAI